jgi:hypothetical protein
MTLQDLFLYIEQNQQMVLIFCLSLPLIALTLGFLSKNKGHLAPWKYGYTLLIYAISIPGILAVGLNIYFFLFQRRDIMQTNLLLQVLPIIVLFVSLSIIRKNIDLSYIPGFDKIYSLWLMLFATLTLMWFLEKINIIIFSFLPFQYLIGGFILLFLIFYMSWKSLRK